MMEVCSSHDIQGCNIDFGVHVTALLTLFCPRSQLAVSCGYLRYERPQPQGRTSYWSAIANRCCKMGNKVCQHVS